MKVSIRSRRMIRLQNILFVVLFLGIIGLLAWLSTRYTYQADWTATGRNTLSQASVDLLRKLDGPLTITAYASESPLLRKRISELLDRYKRYKSDLNLTFINPDLEPQKVRELGITVDGELVIDYAGHQEQLQDVTEGGITNALQRVARGGERRIVFLEGHGERKPQGEARYDLGGFIKQLETKGYQVSQQNLASSPVIPANTSIVVIAGPQSDLLPGEVKIIEDYVTAGGNLLWLADPGGEHGLEPLAATLKINFQPGIIVDPNISTVGMMLFGTDDPRVALVTRYTSHPITHNFDFNTLFPLAGGITIDEDKGDWHAQEFLQTLSNTWSETTQTMGQITFDAGKDIKGPLNIGVALDRDINTQKDARDKQDKDDKGDKNDRNTQDKDTGSAVSATRQQRVVVIGDGDFLSNGFLGLGGNLQLGMNIFNWLSSDDAFISIPVKTAPDISLQFNNTKISIISFGFLIALPLILIASGMVIWWRRRRR